MDSFTVKRGQIHFRGAWLPIAGYVPLDIQRGPFVVLLLNTFDISRGSLSYTIEHFSNLHPSHRALMKTVGIRFGLQDLTSTVFETIDCRGKDLEFDPHSDERIESSRWTWLAYRALDSIWKAKIRWIRDWKSLDSVVLESHYGRMELKGELVQRILQGPLKEDVRYPQHRYEECSREVVGFMRATSREVKEGLRSETRRWKSAKAWWLLQHLLADSTQNPKDHPPDTY